jgi:hypothetical protein
MQLKATPKCKSPVVAGLLHAPVSQLLNRLSIAIAKQL